MKNGSHRNGAVKNGAQVSPAADPLPAAGEAAFFTMTRAECEALHPALATSHQANPLASKVVRRMTEALHGG